MGQTPLKASEVKFVEGEYIVLFKNQFENRISESVGQQVNHLIDQVVKDHNFSLDSITHRYKFALKGFAAKLSKEEVEILSKDSRILKVKPNKLYSLGYIKDSKHSYFREYSNTFKNDFFINQSTPWGVSRVGGPFNGIGKKAWVLDTGIDLDHPDLYVDVSNSASFIATEPADDGNGHGTHVAGIIAAKDNSQDVVGVAAGATVVAIKVCYDESPGPGLDQCPQTSLLNGIDYVALKAQSNDIVNISIWGPVDTDLDNAVINVASTGIRFTLISGNAGANANYYSPGRANHTNIYTVSAHDDNDDFAWFSNYANPPIEYSNPGVDIPSLWTNGGTSTESGTSMAAPHIAGLLLANGNNIFTDGTVNNDADSSPDQIAVGIIPAPIIYASVSNNRPKLDWNTVDGAQSYNIYRRFESGSWSLITNVTGTTFTDTNIVHPDLHTTVSPPWNYEDFYSYRVHAVPASGPSSVASNRRYFSYAECTGPGCGS